ncbi:hypothetical protein ACFOD4_02810 [Pseudoroseomonas globiformis]|uniref:Uncharacterized protein n=1 Tax=Teichococcus globiformis TaxID=2307229 RepID=A0ABV7FXT6_9PROT
MPVQISVKRGFFHGFMCTSSGCGGAHAAASEDWRDRAGWQYQSRHAPRSV